MLLNAELLTGLTLSQLVREGAPVILGSLPANFDMRGTGSFYDSTSYLLNLACAEMMSHYRLPHAGSSGSGMGWGPDLIAGGHQWVNHLTNCIGKSGLAPFVGDILNSKAFSPALVVYANQVVAETRRFGQGFALDDSSVTLDEIKQIGPGGNFLISDSTLKLHRQQYHESKIFPRLSLEAWQEEGSPRAGDRLRQATCQLLDGLSPPEDHADLMGQGEEFVQQVSKRLTRKRFS